MKYFEVRLKYKKAEGAHDKVKSEKKYRTQVKSGHLESLTEVQSPLDSGQRSGAAARVYSSAGDVVPLPPALFYPYYPQRAFS